MDQFIWAASYAFSYVGYSRSKKNSKRVGALLKAIVISFWSWTEPIPPTLVQLEMYAYYRIGIERRLRADETRAWLELDDDDFADAIRKGYR